MKERRLHQVFEIGVLLKSLNALLEIVGGLALYFISTVTIQKWVTLLTMQELGEDPKDFLATRLLSFAQHFSIDTKSFFALYLLSHGVVKLVLMLGLMRGKSWAFPAALVVMSLFIAYQLYRFSYTHAFGLVVLSAFDIILVMLIWHEYRQVKQRRV